MHKKRMILFLAVCTLLSGCGAPVVPESSTVPESVVSSDAKMPDKDDGDEPSGSLVFPIEEKEHADVKDENTKYVNKFTVGGISYDFSASQAGYERKEGTAGIDGMEGGMKGYEGYVAHDEDGNKIASVYCYSYEVKDAEDWAHDKDNLLQFSGYYWTSCSKKYEFDYEPETFKEYRFDAGDYIIHAGVILDMDSSGETYGNTIFDIVAAPKASVLKSGDTAEVYFASIVNSSPMNYLAYAEILSKWSDYFDVDMHPVKEILPEDILSYVISVSTPSGSGGFINENVLESQPFDIKLDTGSETSVEVRYENGIGIVESLINTSDSDSWSNFICKPGKTDAKNFKSGACSVYTYNVSGEDASYGSLPLGGVWVDASKGELSINSIPIRESSDLVGMYGKPYFSSGRIYSDTYGIIWVYKFDGCYLYAKMEEEKVTELGILEDFFFCNASSYDKMDSIKTFLGDLVKHEKVLFSDALSKGSD